MTKKIDIPGVGLVEFPDSMSDDQITQSIQQNILPKYSAQNESATQSFGRGTASLADSAINAVTGTLDMAAYPLARAYYGITGNRTPEQAAALAQQQTSSPKDVVGRAFGVAGTPGYENAPLRRLGTAVGETINEGAVKPIAQATGLPEQDVGNMVGSASMLAGAGVPKVVSAVKPVVNAGIEAGKGLASVAGSPFEAGRGALQGFTKSPGTPSARMPIGDTYIPADILEQYRAGQITAQDAQALARSTSELPQTALQRTQGMVPYAGQEVRAAGEHFGSGYRDPYKAALELGSDYLLGGVPSALRGAMKGYDLGQTVQAYKQLGKSGFSPLTPAEAAELAGKTPPATGPAVPPKAPYPTWSSPTTPPKGPPPPPAPPAGGAVRPSTPAQTNATAMGITPPMTAEQSGFTQQLNALAKGPAVPQLTYNPTMYASETGLAGSNARAVSQAALEQKYPPFKPGLETTAPVPSGMTQFVEQVRSQPTTPAKGADILAQIRARGPQTLTPSPVAGKAPIGRLEIPTTPLVGALDESVTTISGKSATRSAASQAAGAARSELLQDVKDWTSVSKNNNKLTYDKGNFNELADKRGNTINWTNAPDITNMSLKEGRREIRKFVYDELKDTGSKSTPPKDVMSMMGKPSSQLPPGYASKDLSMAILKGSGEWKKGDNAFKVITTPDGTIRLQVRDSVGKVIDERYLK